LGGLWIALCPAVGVEDDEERAAEQDGAAEDGEPAAEPQVVADVAPPRHAGAASPTFFRRSSLPLRLGRGLELALALRVLLDDALAPLDVFGVGAFARGVGLGDLLARALRLFGGALRRRFGALDLDAQLERGQVLARVVGDGIVGRGREEALVGVDGLSACRPSGASTGRC